MVSIESLPQGRIFLPECLSERIDARIAYRERKIEALAYKSFNLAGSLSERSLILSDASRTLARSLFSPKTEQAVERKAQKLVKSRKLAELGGRFPLSDEVRKALEVVLHHRDAVKAENRQKKRAQKEIERKSSEIAGFKKWSYFLAHQEIFSGERRETIFGELADLPLKGRLIEDLLEFAKPVPKDIQKAKQSSGIRKLLLAGLIPAALATAIFISSPAGEYKTEAGYGDLPPAPVVLTETALPTATATATAISAATVTASPTRKPAQTPSPSPTATATATATATQKPPETATPTATSTAAVISTPKPKPLLTGFMKDLNDYRDSMKVAPLDQDDNLCSLAKLRLEYIKPLANNELVGHPGFKAKAEDFFSRFLNLRKLGENLARGLTNPLSAWQRSPDHDKNMLNSQFNAGCFSTDGQNSVLILGEISENGAK